VDRGRRKGNGLEAMKNMGAGARGIIFRICLVQLQLQRRAAVAALVMVVSSLGPPGRPVTTARLVASGSQSGACDPIAHRLVHIVLY